MRLLPHGSNKYEMAETELTVEEVVVHPNITADADAAANPVTAEYSRSAKERDKMATNALAANLLSSTGTAVSEWAIALQAMTRSQLLCMVRLRRLRVCCTITFGAATIWVGYNDEGYFKDAPIMCTAHAWAMSLSCLAGLVATIAFCVNIYCFTPAKHRLPQQTWLVPLGIVATLWQFKYFIRFIEHFPGGTDYCDSDTELKKDSFIWQEIFSSLYLFSWTVYLLLQLRSTHFPLVHSKSGISYGTSWRERLAFYGLPVGMALLVTIVFFCVNRVNPDVKLEPIPFCAITHQIFHHSDSESDDAMAAAICFDIFIIVLCLTRYIILKCHAGTANSILAQSTSQVQSRCERSSGQRHMNIGDVDGEQSEEGDQDDREDTHKQEAAEIDTDHDNKISREEWIAAYGSDEGFDKADIDNSGDVDVDEFVVTKLADGVLQDFKLAQLKFLLGKQYINATTLLYFECQIFAIVMVAVESSPPQELYSPAAVVMGYLNMLMILFVITETTNLTPIKRNWTSTKEEERHYDYAVREKEKDTDPVVFDSRHTLRLNRILFAWNLAELIQWYNENTTEIVKSKEGHEAKTADEIQVDPDTGIGCGVGPLYKDSYRLMLAWYDAGQEWPSLSLPSRLMEKRNGKHCKAAWDREGHKGKGLRSLPQPPGENDLEYSCEVHGSAQFDTKCFMYELEDRVGIVFNGTTDLEHVLADMRIAQDDLSNFITGAASGEMVHQGFNQAFLSMRAGVEFWLGLDEVRKKKPVFLAGHSMGGALATICARYLLELEQYKDPAQLCLVTFGSPCVGNNNFREVMNRGVGEMWRLVCEDDIVPTLLEHNARCLGILESALFGLCCICCCPALCADPTKIDDYCHVGTQVLISTDGMMIADPCFSDKNFMGLAKNVCSTKTLENHFHYDRCLRMWIHQIHAHRENHILDRIIFGHEEDDLRPGDDCESKTGQIGSAVTGSVS